MHANVFFGSAGDVQDVLTGFSDISLNRTPTRASDISMIRTPTRASVGIRFNDISDALEEVRFNDVSRASESDISLNRTPTTVSASTRFQSPQPSPHVPVYDATDQGNLHLLQQLAYLKAQLLAKDAQNIEQANLLLAKDAMIKEQTIEIEVLKLPPGKF